MKIYSNTGGIAQTNSFLIADEVSGQAVLFDAPNDTVAPLLDVVEKEKYRLLGLWLTHGHFDHLADHAVVTARFPEAKVGIHQLDEPKLKDPTSRFFQLPFSIPSRSADFYFEDGQLLKIGSIQLQVLHTPGHSPGHVSFHLPAEHVLVGGDLIIMGAIGRTDFPECDPAKMNDSLRKVMQLPGQTQLLPGHGPTSQLQDERRTNRFVRAALGLS